MNNYGNNKWLLVTVIFGLMLAAMWFVGQILLSNESPATALQERSDPVISDSIDDRSQEFHTAMLKSMGDTMYMDEYVDSRGFTLPLDSYEGYIFGGASHIFAPNSEPYVMQWRLQLGLMFPETKVPVSFLDISYEGPFSHEVAIAAVKEFDRIAGGLVSIEDVQEAMQETEALMQSKRANETSPSMGSWIVESSLPSSVTNNGLVGSYLVKVRIFEWPIEAYIRESGACEVFIFFAYCPPGVTEVDTITSSGFYKINR